MRVRATLLEHSSVVDAQVDGRSKSVTLLARKDELDEKKVTYLMKRKGFKVTKFEAKQLGQIGG